MLQSGSHYDRITPGWSVILGPDFHHGYFASGDEDLATATQALTDHVRLAAGIVPGTRVLDIGCGIGTQARQLAADHGATVLGLSTSRVGIATAREQMAHAGVGGVEFRRADALDNGLPDASFDVVWLIESAQYLVPKDRLMSECARLLREDGRLTLADVVLRRELTLRDLRRLNSKLAVLREVFGDAQMVPAADLGELAEACGLTSVHTTDITAQVLPTYQRWRERALEVRERVEGPLGASTYAAFLEGCQIMAELMHDDVLGYVLLAAHRP